MQCWRDPVRDAVMPLFIARFASGDLLERSQKRYIGGLPKSPVEACQKLHVGRLFTFHKFALLGAT